MRNTNIIRKHPKLALLESLNNRRQAACPGEPLATPSVLHFIQPQLGGVQTTSLIEGALQERPYTKKVFRITNSLMDQDITPLEKFPKREDAATLELLMELAGIDLFLNLPWFLQYQMAQIQFMIRASTKSFAWLLKFLSQIAKIEAKDEVSIVQCKEPLSQDQIFRAKSHCMNKCVAVSL